MRKTSHDREPTPISEPAVAIKPLSKDNKRKRKLDVVPEEDEGPGQAGAKDNSSSHTQSSPQAPSTPVRKKTKSMLPSSPKQTPGRSTAALFGNLQLDTMRPVALVGYETPPYSPDNAKVEDSKNLPEQLQDLWHLYSAFLSALSLYYAHNGSSSPVSVAELLPTVTAHWKQRAVALDDLRKVLAVSRTTESEFILRDCGRAGTCLTRIQPRGRQVKRAGNFVDEVGLSAAFDRDLRERWGDWQTSVHGKDNDVEDFKKQLPMLDIQQDEKAKAALSRGQQRLADLKSSSVKPESATKSLSAPSFTNTAPPAPQGLQNRGTNLLDRILAKQAHTASLPAGPTKTQLERKAALHRIEDIARVLDLLAAGRPRCSFSLQAMTQQLQQSLRNPISREEVEMCLELMAAEITPGFVGLLRSGSMISVVVTKGGKVELGLLRSRVLRAVGEEKV